MNGGCVLSVKALTKSFKDSPTPILDSINFQLHPGDVYCLLGANGCGKTTFLRTLTGIYPPASGEILFWDKPLTRKARKKIGYLEDKMPEFPFLRVRDYMELSLSLFGYASDERGKLTEQYLNRVGLWDAREKYLGALSHGMEKRLGIAQMISHDPEILFFDEPLEGLDMEGLFFFQNFLADCRQQKRTVLLTTHLYAQIKQMGTAAGILLNGKIQEVALADMDAGFLSQAFKGASK